MITKAKILLYVTLSGIILLPGCLPVKEKSEDYTYLSKDGVFSLKLNGCYIKHEQSKMVIQSEGNSEFVLQINTKPELSIIPEMWDTCITVSDKSIYLYRQRYKDREEPIYYYYCQIHSCEMTGYFVGEYMPDALLNIMHSFQKEPLPR